MTKIVALIQDRLKLLSEAQELIEFFFQDDTSLEMMELIQRGMDPEVTALALNITLNKLEEMGSFSAENLENSLLDIGSKLELSRRQFLGMLRIALTGRKVSPPIFETMEVLGRDMCIRRLKSARSSLV